MKYKVGTDDPRVWRDVGSGPWNVKPKTVEMRAKKAGILGNLAAAEIFVGHNATLHLTHYFLNSGRTLTINLEGMLANVPSAMDLLKKELKAARDFSQSLRPGEYQITSTKTSAGYNTPLESKDWYYAVGGYEVWGKGNVTVPSLEGYSLGDSPAKAPRFSMDFELCFFDCYNWNGGASVSFAGVTISDEFMGEFHKQGLAREFEMRGSYHFSVEWPLMGKPVVTGHDISLREILGGHSLWE